MAVNIFDENITFTEIPKTSDLAKMNCSLLSTYTSKGAQPHPPGPDGTKCYCIECAEWKFGERIPNGIPTVDSIFAGYTCNWCPNQHRPLENEHSFGGYENTERCTICSRDIKSWQRASQLADELIEFRNDTETRLRFLTLTLPNYQDNLVGLADLKKKIKNFRRSTAFKTKVVGGVDFYEWTTASDGTYNVHYHGIWAGNYWKQSDLLDSWSHGGARIELVKARHEAADTIRYCTKYLTKMKEFGIRTKQKFGDFYNYSGQGTEPVTSSRQ